METRRFGNTGLDVPVVGMGTWQTFDVRGADADARRAVVDAAFEEGATRIIGLAHYSPHAFDDLRRLMSDPRVGAIQVPYNPREREIEAAILPAAADLGLGVVIMRPFGQGDLARRRIPKDALAPLAPYGVTSWPQAVLKWILSETR